MMTGIAVFLLVVAALLEVLHAMATGLLSLERLSGPSWRTLSRTKTVMDGLVYFGFWILHFAPGHPEEMYLLLTVLVNVAGTGVAIAIRQRRLRASWSLTADGDPGHDEERV